MIHCAIIDDEPYARDLLKDFISKIPDWSLVGSYSSALQALPVVSKQRVDVLFLDIQMPDLTGIDFLKSLDRKPMVIFTTAYAEYAIEGFELDVLDYLLKPFDFQRFLKAINKATQKLEKTPEVRTTEALQGSTDKEFIFLKDGTRLVKVDLGQILFIKGTREYVSVFTKDKKIMTLQTMKQLEQDLPGQFVRVHNSFIVNLRAVETIEKDEIQISDEIIPIGNTYKKGFLEAVRKFFPG